MSSFTNFLNLFKWNAIEDAEEEFNIDKALNENWDKIDTKLETYMTDLTNEVNQFTEDTNATINNYKTSTDKRVDELETQISSIKEISISATEPTADEVLWVKRGKNLIDFSKCMMGQELHSSTGDWAINPEYYTTNYIRVQAGRTYTSSGLSTPNRAYYDKNFNYLGRTMTETAIAPENSYYTKLVSLIEGYSTPQLEEGSVATDYEPYIETTVNVKENGSFSEILNVDEVKDNIKKIEINDFFISTNYTILEFEAYQYGKIVNIQRMVVLDTKESTVEKTLGVINQKYIPAGKKAVRVFGSSGAVSFNYICFISNPNLNFIRNADVTLASNNLYVFNISYIIN